MLPSVFELSSLNGTNGFSINGTQTGDQLGISINHAGDVNGDGLQDFIVGASEADPNGQNSGQAYLIFGQRRGLPINFNVSALNGRNGFRMSGIAELDRTGLGVNGAGDINGDGLADIVIGAPQANTPAANAGRSYVLFGRRGQVAADIQLAALNGANGFQINGVDADDLSGFAVSNAGDINGDRIDDLLIGAYGANPNTFLVGQSYVVFGRPGGFGSSLNLASLNGINGFKLDGINPDDRAGFAVTALGDVNGDRLDDLLIGAPEADPGRFGSGQAYVVFGRRGGFPANLSLFSLNGSTGFRLDGLVQEGNLGFSVGGRGDFNGDGINDFVIGAPNTSLSSVGVGRVYVVFGRTGGFPATFNLAGLNGANGFIIDGINGEDQTGYSVDLGGDVNNDGYFDVLIGAPGADPNGLSSGRAYVVYGRPSDGQTVFNLASLNGSNGFVINGITARDGAGQAVSHGGDINGDGIDDLLIGAPNADPDGSASTGQSYVIYGVAGPIPGLSLQFPTIDASGFDRPLNANLNKPNLVIPFGSRSISRSIQGYQNVIGTAFRDRLRGNRQANILAGNAGDDVLRGLGNNDELNGGLGRDTCFGGQGRDRIFGADGNDRLLGEGSNDFLVGGSNNDTLLGGQGDDTLTGSTGTDRLDGGGGNDDFVFNIGRPFQRNAMGVDRVVNFAPGSDRIVLDRSTFTRLRGKQVRFANAGTVAEAARSNAFIVYVRSQRAVFYNANGRSSGFGAGGQFALLPSRPTLSAADFIIQA